MSILINDDLIWIAVPRCASTSIEKNLLNSNSNSNLNCEHIRNYEKIIKKHKKDKKQPIHFHYKVDLLYNKFGYKDTICIKRDWFERWMSSLLHLYYTIRADGFTPIIDFEDIDNDFIYNVFDIEFVTDLYSFDDERQMVCYSKLIKESFDIVKEKSIKYKGVVMLLSQNYWTDNEKCTYEFELKEIDKFEKFIEDRYNIEFKLKKLNSDTKLKSNIVGDDKLKKYLWGLFESQYVKKSISQKSII